MATQLAKRYHLLEKLGSGGMGVVYRARDPWLERDVAIKMVPPSKLDAVSEERFRREARLVARMDHPGIVPIHDFGQHESSLFFVMPLIQGSTLKELQTDRLLPVAELLTIAIDVAEALSHAHDRGVIHRDVSPTNIMVSRQQDNDELRVRVMDFGLARGSQEAHVSRTGILAGTPAYLSPEQVTGHDLTGATDLYSLGAVLYESLTGELIFDGALASVMYRIVREAPPPMATHGPRRDGAALDQELERLVLWCLEKRPDARPANGRQLAESLHAYLRADNTKAEADVPGSRPARPDSFLALVGREREWAWIQESLDATLAGECHLILLGGEAGVGKTRLLEELENTALERRVLVLKGRYSDLEASFHYEGLCELIQDYFRNLDPLRSSARIANGVRPATIGSLDFTDLAPDLLALFPVLSEIPELRDAACDRPGEDPEDRIASRPTYVFELFARTLTRLAQGEPLVLLIENLHEADASIEALQYLVHRLAPVPILIAGSYRPAQTDRGHPLLRWIRGLRDHPRARTLALEPLSADDLRQLGESVVGHGRLSDNLAERLFEATEGNPLFALELLRSLLETGGLIESSSGEWTLVGEAALTTRGALPLTLQQAVERRLERLPDALRSLLAVAAVLGKSFDARDLEAMTDGALVPDPVEQGTGQKDLDALDELIEQQLLREDRKARGDRLVFVSGLVRTVLYRDLSRRRRRAIHRRFADHLEQRGAGKLERFYPLLVHHFSAGDVPDKTVEYALAQARWSLAAWNPDDAIRAVRIALELIEDATMPEVGRLHGELLVVLASAHRTLGQNAQALGEAAKAVSILRRADSPRQAADAAWLATQAAWQGRRVEETRHWLDQTAELARQVENHDLCRSALLLGSTVANLRGETDLARRYREEATAIASTNDESDDAEPTRPPRGGTLRAVLPISLHHFDPAEVETDEGAELVSTVFETLNRLDREGNFLPALCQHWTSLDDGSRFELILREDIRFSDGKAVMATDVKASFERLARRRIDSPPPALSTIAGHGAFLRGETAEIVGIEVSVEQPTRIVFHLKEPLAIFPVLLTDGYTAIVRQPDGARHLLGTGPFQLAAHENHRIVLAPNLRYRGESPRLDHLEFRTALSATETAEELRSDSIDLGRDLLLPDLENLLREPRFRSGLVETTRKNVHFLLWNQHGPNARHAALRRALSAVVNPNDIVWRTLGRFGQPAVCLMPPGILGHDPGRRLRRLKTEACQDLLRDARLTRPIRLTAAVHPVLRHRCQELIEALFQTWSVFGVEVEVLDLTLEAFLDKYHDHQNVDLMLARWNADYNDPDNFTHALFHSQHGIFRHYYSCAEADDLLERARLETGASERLVLYRRFENLLEQGDILVPLFHDVAYRLAGPRVKGLELASVPPYVNYAGVGKIAAEDDDITLSHWPQARGELHIPIIAPLRSLDPVGDTFAEHLEVTSSLFEGLTRLDENAGVTAWLAESFASSADGKTYRFQLRDDVRFHDGRRLTTRDVRYSFERALRASRTGLHFLLLPIRGARAVRDGQARHIEGISIHSAHELIIELEQPLPFFTALLAHPGCGIVAEGGQQFTGSWRDGSVGTGPFRVLRFEPGGHIELERHPQYWRPGLPLSERLTFHTGRPPRQIADDFRAGRYSLASDLHPRDVDQLRRDPKLASGGLESPRLSTVFLVFNSQRAPLADRGLRRCLARALDIPSLFDRVAGPQAQKAQGLIPPGLVGHEDPRLKPEEPLDTSPLRGIRLKVAVIPGYIGQYAKVWRELQQRLERLGVVLEVLDAPVSKLVQMTLDGVPDVLCMRWLADYPDPDSFVSSLLHSSDGILRGMCNEPEIDAFCERGRSEIDPALRHAIYRELEEHLARQTHIVPLLHEQSYRFHQPTVRGVKIYFGLPEIRYEEIQLS